MTEREKNSFLGSNQLAQLDAVQTYQGSRIAMFFSFSRDGKIYCENLQGIEATNQVTILASRKS